MTQQHDDRKPVFSQIMTWLFGTAHGIALVGGIMLIHVWGAYRAFADGRTGDGSGIAFTIVLAAIFGHMLNRDLRRTPGA